MKLATPLGARTIGSLKVGDQVTAYDPRTGTSSTQTVQHVWVNHDHDLLDVTLHEDGTATQAAAADAAPDKAQEVATKAHGSQAPPPPSDETIHTTEQHPWLTTDRGWVQAGDLHVGEQVVELGGRTATITALAVRPGAATYYNLTVSRLHTYAVGASRAVVHNTGPCVVRLNDPNSEISRVSMWARMENKITRGQNVAVYRLRSGEYLAAANVPKGLHSEEILNRYIVEHGIDPEDVMEIYSERIPCDTGGHMCMDTITKLYPNARDNISFSLNLEIDEIEAGKNAASIGYVMGTYEMPAEVPGYRWIAAP